MAVRARQLARRELREVHASSVASEVRLFVPVKRIEQVARRYEQALGSGRPYSRVMTNDRLTVHHLGHSQSERVVWLCEELGLDYDLKHYDRRPDNKLGPPE